MCWRRPSSLRCSFRRMWILVALIIKIFRSFSLGILSILMICSSFSTRFWVETAIRFALVLSSTFSCITWRSRFKLLRREEWSVELSIWGHLLILYMRRVDGSSGHASEPQILLRSRKTIWKGWSNLEMIFKIIQILLEWGNCSQWDSLVGFSLVFRLLPALF